MCYEVAFILWSTGERIMSGIEVFSLISEIFSFAYLILV